MDYVKALRLRVLATLVKIDGDLHLEEILLNRERNELEKTSLELLNNSLMKSLLLPDEKAAPDGFQLIIGYLLAGIEMLELGESFIKFRKKEGIIPLDKIDGVSKIIQKFQFLKPALESIYSEAQGLMDGEI